MICYIVTETLEKYRGMDCHKVKLVLEECSGEVCLVMHYSQVTRALMEEMRPLAVCHSGGVTGHREYDILDREDYRWLIVESDIPQLGLCGGHQLIGEMHGAEVEPMRELRPDEHDPHPDYHPGLFKEWGVYPVRVVAEDPLFEGLGEVVRVQEYHRCELTELPDGFRLLASTDECAIQAMVAENRPVYGVQFHPEHASDDYPDGRRLLENFFAIAQRRRS
ncbi:MAG: gamma-glutamyl-gamma-aminobutyrate hydrolase family protein [Armatimonadetes bacterium]|nr:gamma-glutamyl-gamma-aminobutyrate hydrolase family protein [Armatimonadota bacterium]